MINIIITIIKTLIMLGILVIVHEGGHFVVAKLCKIKVNEFSVGFGKQICSKEFKGTKYALRLIPLGGYVRLEGEEEYSEKEGSFSTASAWKKVLILIAGATVNILFGILLYFLLITVIYDIQTAMSSTGNFINALFESVKILFSGQTTIDDLAGPVGIANIVSQTSGIADFMYLLSVVSLSLGITNLIPIPPLDGGKILLTIIEKIKGTPLKEDISLKIQMMGFALILGLSVVVMYNDITNLF